MKRFASYFILASVFVCVNLFAQSESQLSVESICTRLQGLKNVEVLKASGCGDFESPNKQPGTSFNEAAQISGSGPNFSVNCKIRKGGQGEFVIQRDNIDVARNKDLKTALKESSSSQCQFTCKLDELVDTRVHTLYDRPAGGFLSCDSLNGVRLFVNSFQLSAFAGLHYCGSRKYYPFTWGSSNYVGEGEDALQELIKQGLCGQVIRALKTQPVD